MIVKVLYMSVWKNGRFYKSHAFNCYIRLCIFTLLRQIHRSVAFRCGLPGPLVDGCVVSESVLPSLLRLTVISIARRKTVELEKLVFLEVLSSIFIERSPDRHCHLSQRFAEESWPRRKFLNGANSEWLDALLAIVCKHSALKISFLLKCFVFFKILAPRDYCREVGVEHFLVLRNGSLKRLLSYVP